MTTALANLHISMNKINKLNNKSVSDKQQNNVELKFAFRKDSEI